MVHKILGEIYDMLLFLCGVLGILVFFLLYWKESFQIRYAESVLREFAEKVAVTGKITGAEYGRVLNELYSVETDIALKIQCFLYEEQPVYAYLSEEEWKKYFQDGNQIVQTAWKEYSLPLLQGDENEMQLQTETNATVLAAEQQDYLPLPYENAQTEIIAVRPEQKLYEGEKLVTLCRVVSPDGNYYIEAPDVVAKQSGTIQLKLILDEKEYLVPIEVLCYSRTLECENGHKIPNTKAVIDERKETGYVSCPYCRIIPKSICAMVEEPKLMTGDELTKACLQLEVLYLDGSIGYATPESEDWQDNYDAGFCGDQTVTVRYRNAETQIMIKTENGTCKQCGKECNDRCLKDYRDYPYCIGCLSKMLKFTGKTKLKEEIINTRELVSKLDKEGKFLFQRDDFVTMELQLGKRKTLVQQKITMAGKNGEIQ